MRLFLTLVCTLTFCIAWPAAAQQPSLQMTVTIETGEDGTADNLTFTLTTADANSAPLDQTKLLDNPDDLAPGSVNTYELSFDGVDYCAIGGFEIRLDGTDSWSPESIQVTVDDAMVYNDPEASVFAPFTQESYPINGRWTRTAAYLSRCAPDELLQVPTVIPTQSIIILTPIFTATPATLVATPVTCPGFLPSRLVMGGQGRVSSGAYNNLRTNPNRSASVIGQIPPGGEFQVLVGPGCDPQGIAWWQVTYDGQAGWTAEGMGSEYYLEPVTQ